MEGIEVEVQGADEGMEHTASKKVSSDSDLQEVWMMVNRRRQEKKKKTWPWSVVLSMGTTWMATVSY